MCYSAGESLCGKEDPLTARLPSVSVRGTPQERGRQYGEADRDRIHQTLDRCLGFMAASTGMDRAEALAGCSYFLPASEAWCPGLLGELQGIAEGAGLAFREVFFINAFLDLYYLHILKRGAMPADPPASGCTAYAACPPATRDGMTYVAQTDDYLELFADCLVVLSLELQGVNASVVSLAGGLGEFGMNSAGICLVANGLFTSDVRAGVPFVFVVRQALAQERVGDAMMAVLSAPRASASNYLLGDAHGDVFSLECTATDWDILTPRDGIIVHTNHVLSSRLRPLEMLAKHPSYGGSVIRLERMKKKLAARQGDVTLQDMECFCNDHVNFPFSICAHPDPGRPEIERTSTLCAAIMVPGAHEMRIAWGNICQNEFLTYRIDAAA
jgi:isopenicillin-N N-acyltransferase-like protein